MRCMFIIQMTWLAGMEGIAADYRHMEGYGVNTFTLINHEGKDTYVKFHWRPRAGASHARSVPKLCPHLLFSLGRGQGHLCEISLAWVTELPVLLKGSLLSRDEVYDG